MKVYCINLKRSTDRRAKMEAELGNLGLPFDFLDAVDGRLLTRGEKRAAYSHWRALCRHGLGLTAGEIGVAMSHCKFFEKIIANNESGFVVEDDVSFTAASAMVFVEVEEFLKKEAGPTLVQLPGIDRELRSVKGLEGKFVKVQSAMGAYAYGVNPEGARLLLKFFTPIKQPIDKYDYIIKHSGLNFFVYTKLALSVNMNGESMVGDDRKRYTGWRLYLFRIWRCIGMLIDRVVS